METHANIYERRKIDVLTWGILGFFFILVFIMPLSHASGSSDFIDSMCTMIIDSGVSVIDETIHGEGLLAPMLTLCTGSADEIASATAIKSLKGVGALLVLAIAIIHLFEMLDREQDKLEAIFKMLVEIIVTCLFLVNAEKIMGILTDAGLEMVKLFSSPETEEGLLTVDALKQAISGKTDGGIFWFIECFAKLSIPWVMSVLLGIAAKFVIIQLLLEIAIRRVFAPIAITDIYKEGIRSPGFRYFKKFFAVFVKLVICALIAILMPKILDTVGSNIGEGIMGALNYIFTIVACNFAAIGMMLKAGEFANDIVGV